MSDILGQLNTAKFTTSSITVTEAAIASQYSVFNAHTTDVYDATWNGGAIQAGMGTTGGRADLGPYPTWTVMWFYSGDWRLRKIALTYADLSCGWFYHHRETDPTRRMLRTDPAGSGTGLGHTFSTADRKTLYLDLFNLPSGGAPGDQMTKVGWVVTHDAWDPMKKWSWDGAHQPQMYFPQYILTGDPYYLTEIYMWNSFSGIIQPFDKRGVTGAYGGIGDQIRGSGRVIKHRVEAWLAAPDGAPEKEYFAYLTEDAFAQWEGKFGITGTIYDGTAQKATGIAMGEDWASAAGINFHVPPPLHNWENNGDAGSIAVREASGAFLPGVVGSIHAVWQHHIVTEGIARAYEIGFNGSIVMLLYNGKFETDAILHSGAPHWIGFGDWVPGQFAPTATGAYMTFADFKGCYA